jgi:enamine deaminase RidA (YjgF/YER057c/UK114 family)
MHMSRGHEERLAQLGIELPAPSRPVANYLSCKRSGDLLHVGGHGPVSGRTVVRGKVGGAVALEEGKEAARLTALSILATVRDALGSLDRVRQVVKVFGMVNCAPGFNRTPEVIDGCSDLLVAVFDEAGRHTRSAVGMAELPFDIAVEIEAIFEVD